MHDCQSCIIVITIIQTSVAFGYGGFHHQCMIRLRCVPLEEARKSGDSVSLQLQKT